MVMVESVNHTIIITITKLQLPRKPAFMSR